GRQHAHRLGLSRRRPKLDNGATELAPGRGPKVFGLERTPHVRELRQCDPQGSPGTLSWPFANEYLEPDRPAKERNLGPRQVGLADAQAALRLDARYQEPAVW